MRIELLYFDGCPSHERLLHTVGHLADEAGAEVAMRRIHSAEEAEAERFLGSPTVRVEGRDVEPGAETRTDFGLKCRLYRTEAGLTGTPADEWLEAALRPIGAPYR